MPYHLGVEDMEVNHWIAYVFDLPGCYSSAETQEGAVLLAPARIAEYFDWRVRHGRPSPLADAGIVTQVDEVFRSFPDKDNPDYIVNAFFKDDRRALRRDEIDEALGVLEQTRADLLAVAERITPSRRKKAIAEDRFKRVNDILMHVAWAEWWYFDRLGLAFPRDDMPNNTLKALDKVRAHSLAALPALAGDTRIVELSSESWSARKVVRRMLWHERDHTQHIAKVIRDES
jgi:predicted RNase H-like HicB family nuclease